MGVRFNYFAITQTVSKHFSFYLLLLENPYRAYCGILSDLHKTTVSAICISQYSSSAKGVIIWYSHRRSVLSPTLLPAQHTQLFLVYPCDECPRRGRYQVLGEENPQRRAKKAVAIVREATSEVPFASRRGHPRTGVLVVSRVEIHPRLWSVPSL